MRNHWMKLHEQKKNRFWTAEFSKNGKYLLKPRRVEIKDKLAGLRSVLTITILFKGAMINSYDNELVDLFTEARKSMAGWRAKLHHYQSISNELEYFDVWDLGYANIGVADDIEDIKFIFGYNQIRHVAA